MAIYKNFYAHTVRNANGCLEWQRGKDSYGYGILWVPTEGRVVLAHRHAWQLTFGPIQGGAHVLHKCDNPCCVNTEHLFLGTATDNARDRESKGRGWSTQITADIARNIREEHAAGAKQTELAEKYGTTKGNVWCIVHRKNWAWT